MHRERMIPCLIPLYQALEYEWAETQQLETKGLERAFDGEQNALHVKARIEELRQQSCSPQFVAELSPTAPLPSKYQHQLAVNEKRLARQYATQQHNSKVALRSLDLAKKYLDTICPNPHAEIALCERQLRVLEQEKEQRTLHDRHRLLLQVVSSRLGAQEMTRIETVIDDIINYDIINEQEIEMNNLRAQLGDEGIMRMQTILHDDFSEINLIRKSS